MDDAAEVLEAAALDLARTLELEEVLEKLLGHLGRLVPYDTANVMLLEGEDRLAVRAIRGYERWGAAEVAAKGVFDLPANHVLQEVIESGKSVLIADTALHPHWQRYAGATHVRNFIGVPLRAAGRVIGLYAVDKAVAGFFTPEHVRRTETLAPHAAVAIRNARLFERVQGSEERFRALVEHSFEGMWLMDEKGLVTWTTPSAAQMLGEPVSDIVGRKGLDRVHPEDLPHVHQAFERCLRSPGAVITSRFRVFRRDGWVRHLDAVAVNRLDDPRVQAVVLNYHDVTEAVTSGLRIEDLNRHLQRQVAEFQTLLEVIPIGIGIARDRECRRVDANPYLLRLMGLAPGYNISYSAAPGETPGPFQYVRDGRVLEPPEMPMQKAAAEGRVVVDYEMELVREGAPMATILCYAAPLFDEAGKPRGAIGAALDISERKRAEHEIRRLAYHDTLTGLPNRLLFRDHLDLAIAQARRSGTGLSVLFLDVDHFKVINDSLGHSLGDRLIREVADRVRACIREGDTVARLGGDEFIVLLTGVGQAVGAAKVAEKALVSIRSPFNLEGHELFVTASVGVSVYPADGEDAETLVKNADVAMYRAKDQGRDGYQLFAPAMNAAAGQRLELESRLRRALAHDELELHYQPLMDLARGVPYGVEALLRWRLPEGKLVPPAEFIPLAETTGIIIPMGPWVLRTACAQARAWEADGLGEMQIAVNLSARQFQEPDLVRQVREVLKTTGLPPDRLQIEITETSAMQNALAAAATFRELRDLGIRIAIDDFGTGYSSLSYLKRFPISILKIDQSFVRELPEDPDDVGIATAVIGLARALELDVVAEGVETREQMEFLRSLGCHRAQGYLFSRPLPAAECAAFLKARR
jgi:diguanylate cyclase (GGDEF)-like protein/PAS domain S-box-containing protein